MVCFLEQYPRNPGHTIILVKPHYEDISELPVKEGTEVFQAVLSVTRALKEAVGAEKVYVCTMCDGGRNHFHFQLIPRMPGDSIQGSRLFVKERNFLSNYVEDVQRLSLHMVEQ